MDIIIWYIATAFCSQIPPPPPKSIHSIKEFRCKCVYKANRTVCVRACMCYHDLNFNRNFNLNGQTIKLIMPTTKFKFKPVYMHFHFRFSFGSVFHFNRLMALQLSILDCIKWLRIRANATYSANSYWNSSHLKWVCHQFFSIKFSNSNAQWVYKYKWYHHCRWRYINYSIEFRFFRFQCKTNYSIENTHWINKSKQPAEHIN